MEEPPYTSVIEVLLVLSFVVAATAEEGGDDSMVQGCGDSFCTGCEECTRAMQKARLLAFG